MSNARTVAAAPVPFYTKVVQGHVEQVYDTEGNCVEMRFVAHESDPVDRRIIRQPGDVVQNGELEDDEVITHPEDLKYILSRERFCPYEMVPVRPAAR